uniref:RNA-directed RNA polymerase n=1 Tax=Crane fly tombus-like virus 3 TaxID=2499250 RepID=A0A3S9W0M1_9TOMB|nr:hypothetical protein 3 [Crane fly tombus-like virus 3]
MSGDVDTGFGNSLINYYIIIHLLRELNIEGDVIVNGDDFIIFTNSLLPNNFAELLRNYNMDTVLKPTTTRIHTVEVCRSKLIFHPNGHATMAFDPHRLIDIYGCTYHNYPARRTSDNLTK